MQNEHVLRGSLKKTKQISFKRFEERYFFLRVNSTKHIISIMSEFLLIENFNPHCNASQNPNF